MDNTQLDETLYVLEPATAQLTVRDYVCAKCWSHLIPFYHKLGTRVTCPNCGDGQGFVTKTYATRRRTNDHADAQEVAQLLTTLGITERSNPTQTAQEILADLGF